MIVTHEGFPCAYPRLASPGAVDDPRAAELILLRHAVPYLRWRDEVSRLRERMGLQPPGAPTPVGVSVVVCTRRRPGMLAGALAALGALDPAPDEVLVVDNDPDSDAVHAAAVAAGARYVREDRPGLDRARTRGWREARCEVVAFIDDDCRPPRHWLRGLASAYADPVVGAVCGPAFAAEVETPAQDYRERLAGFVHSLRRRRFDWTTLAPVSSGAAGAGANMTFRREVLEAIGDPFPPDLDVGTPARGGGDLYALYRVLAGGWQLIYDPDAWVLHHHPSDMRALHETAHGYGLGFAAFLTKVLVEDRELAGFLAWPWLWRQYRRAVLSSLSGPDPVMVRVWLNYLRGGLKGPAAWWRARRAGRGEPGALPAPGAGRTDTGALDARGGSRATRPSPPPESAPEAVEVVVADSASARNRALRASAAELLVFLDRAAEPEAGMAASHLAAHRTAGRRALVIGDERVRGDGGLAAQRGVLRAGARRRLRASARLTIADVPSSNFSMRRELLVELGGFDERLGGARAAQDLALRALEAGAGLVHEPGARSRRVAAPDTAAAVAEARRAGADLALMSRSHPAAAAAVEPLTARQARRHPFRAAAGLALRCDPARAWAVRLAAVFEAARLRGAWLAVVDAAEHGAFLRGWREGSGVRPTRAPELVVDLAADDPLPPPAAASPHLELRIGGRRVARLRPPFGSWHPDLAEHCFDHLGEEDWRALGAARGDRHALRTARDKGRHGPGTAPEAGRREPARAAEAESGGDPPAERLDAWTVVLPPGAPGDDFARAGATVERVQGWEGLDGAIRAARGRLVAVSLPGVSVRPAWLQELGPLLAGDRVAAVVGCGLGAGQAPPPARLVSRRIQRTPYGLLGPGLQYLALSCPSYERLGGLDPARLRLGPEAAALDLLQRALDQGLVVGHLDTPGIDPPGAARPARNLVKWRGWRARGRLLAADAAGRGAPGGAALLAAQAVGPLAPAFFDALRRGQPGTVRHVAGTAAALWAGVGGGLVRGWLRRSA